MYLAVVDSSIVSPILSQGVLGVVVIGLVYTVMALYKENKTLHDRIDVLQDARRTDAVETAEKIIPVMSSFSQTAALIYDKLKK